MNTRFFAYIGFAFALIGCGTVQTGTHGTFLPTPSNGFKGLIGWVTNGPQYKEMTDNCASYGGVKNWEQARGWEKGGVGQVARFQACERSQRTAKLYK